ncbi:MAG: lipid II flippase MurJ [Candidatus Paceibacterota bacterium]|jgi:putative peptidoglycan lipid II flippase
MVKRIIDALSKEVSGLHEAAFLLGFFAVASQILALLRDRLFANYFGAGPTLDVYYAAFRIPDALYVVIASFVSVSVIIPFLSRMEGDETKAKRFVSEIFTIFSLVMVFSSVVVFFLIPYLAPLIAPGFSEEQINTLIVLSRILLLSPFILGLSNNIFGSITQFYKRFFVYALAPVLYNAGIIVGVFLFYPTFGMKGLAFGVVFGALLHVLVQLPVAIERGFMPRFVKEMNWKDISQVVVVSLPRTITLSANHFVLIALGALASTMYVGSISIFNFSFNLQSVPLATIGVAYSMAAFPMLASFFTRGEKERFVEHMITALRHIIFWSVPITVLFIVLRAQIVRTILGSGAFSWNDTRLTAAALALFSFSVLTQSLTVLFSRGYHAAGDTRKPLFINLFSSVGAIGGAFWLVVLFEKNTFFQYFIESILRVDYIPGTIVLMLPLAYSIASIINATMHWFMFEKDFNIDLYHIIRKTFFESFSASVIMGFVAYNCLNFFALILNTQTAVGIFLQGFLSGGIGIIFGIIVLKILKNSEIRDISFALHKKFWKADVVAPAQEEL